MLIAKTSLGFICAIRHEIFASITQFSKDYTTDYGTSKPVQNGAEDGQFKKETNNINGRMYTSFMTCT